ncbi:MAG: nucleotidyltransferase family protein [Gammaproteobacteria bacterium]
MGPSCLLIDLLLNPLLCRGFSLRDWETVIRQARVSSMQVRLATRLQEEGLYDDVPLAPQRHLEAALTLRDRQRVAVRWEVEYLARMTASVNVPLVLLKGAAYEMARLPPGRCRVFADFDLLVPREALERVEIAAMTHGWTSAHQNAYDQRYYRQWMHELPPMRHITRRSVIDIHHNLVPDTARLQPNAASLLADSVACPDRSDVRVLSPPDMVLHSVVHLFHDGEFDKGLRDLFDLRDLLEHFMTSAEDWQLLTTRARNMGLQRPLYYALRYLQRWLDTPVPFEVTQQLQGAKPAVPARLMDATFERGLLPNHETCSDRWCAPARLLLYARGHALRMPPHLLVPHLFRKALRRLHLANDG